MDSRGGTITWILDAEDRGFAATNRRVRAEAKVTARSVDRDLKKGTDGANNSLRDFRVELAQTASVVRNFQIATRGFNLTTLILGVATLTGLALELGSAVIVSTGALLSLPGILASVAGALGVARIATLGLDNAFQAVIKGDAKKLAEAMQGLSPAGREVVIAFKDIKKSFEPVQQAVQQAFFLGLGDQMRSVAKTSLPVLKQGMEGVATATNNLLKEVARVSREPFFQGAIRDVLKSTAKSTDTLKGAVEPLAQAIVGLVRVGLPYTDMLAEWTVQLSKPASAYTTSVEGQRQITSAINLGVKALQKIGKLAGSIGSFFVELFKISNEEGVSFIDTFTQVVDKMTAWVKTEEGQRELQALLRLTNEVLVETLKVLGKVAQIILDLVEAFDRAPQPIKDTVLQFLAWTAVLTPIVTYFSALSVSINTAYEGIKLFGRTLGGTIPVFKRGFEGVQRLVQGFNDARVAGSTFSGRMGTIGGRIRSAADAAIDFGKKSASATVSWAKNAASVAGTWVKTSAQAAVNASKSAASWILNAGKVAVAWVVQMAKVVASWVATSAKAAAHAIKSGAIWIAQAVRVAIQWTISMAIVVARQVWAGFQSQAPAVAAGIVWIVNAIKVAAVWTAQMAIVVAQWVATAAKSAINAVIAGAQWIAQATAVALAWVASMATLVAQWVATAAKSAASAVVAGARWLIQPGLIAAAWSAGMAKVATVGALNAGKSAASGLLAAGTWLLQPVLIAGAWIANMARIAVAQLAFIAQNATRAALAAGPWIVQAAAISFAWIFNFAKMIPFLLGASLGFVANAIMVGVAWVAAAVAATAAWIIANIAIIGVVALIIAVVAGAVFLIVRYWDTIKNAAITAGNGIKNAFVTAINFIRDVWNGVVNFIKGAGGGLVKGIKDQVAGFVNGGKDLINGLVRGLDSAKDAVVNKIKEICQGSLDSIKSFFGIHSPSRVMARMGNYMMEGLQKGIIETGKAVIGSTRVVAEGITSSFDSLDGSNFSATIGANSLDIPDGGTAGAQSTGSASIVQNNNIYNQVDLDSVTRELAWQVRR